MYAWEHAFRGVVDRLRRLGLGTSCNSACQASTPRPLIRLESCTVLKSSMIRAINFAIFTVSLTTIMFLVFSVYTGTGGVLSPKKVFTILSLTATLRVNSIHFFVLCVLGLSEIFVAISRIQVGFRNIQEYQEYCGFHFTECLGPSGPAYSAGSTTTT